MLVLLAVRVVLTCLHVSFVVYSTKLADESVILLTPIPSSQETDSKRQHSSRRSASLSKYAKQKAQRRSRQLLRNLIDPSLH